MKKLSLLLNLLLLTSLIAACGSGSEDSSGTTAANTAAEETAAAETSIYSDLGEHDFDGAVFTIAVCTSQMGSEWPYCVTEENGDLVNDAVYRRDLAVSEKYNTAVEYYDTSNTSYGENVASLLSASVMAGDNEYSLGIGHMFSGVNALVSAHGLYNFNDLPYVDFDKPWWAQHLRDQLDIGGVLLLNAGDMVYNIGDCIYFNRDLLEDYQISDDPYDLVTEGTWTFDRMTDMAKQVSSDLNGDGVFDENDLYGYTMSINTYIDSNWVYACGLTIVRFEDGKISLDNVISERMVKSVETLYELVHGGEYTYTPTASGKETLEDLIIFLDGRALFTENVTNMLPKIRDYDLEFGIVPVPKLDEQQDSYYTMATTQMMMVPVTITDSDFIGLMLEALSMESNRIINPAVYEVSFSAKYLRDEKSYEMYNIIRSSGVYDFNWNYGAGNVFAQLMSKIVRNGTPDQLSSFYAANEASVLKNLNTIYEVLLEYGK